MFLNPDVAQSVCNLHLPVLLHQVKTVSCKKYVVVVYHVTIVATGHGFLKKFWPLALGCVLRTAGSYLFETMQTRLLR